MKHQAVSVFIIPVLVVLAVVGCRGKVPVIESFNGYAQGTTYSVVFEKRRHIDPVRLKSGVEAILKDFDMSLSLYKDSSIISRLNRNEDVIPDKYFLEAFRKSEVISAITGGTFDITVGPLVRAWGFGPDAHRSFDTLKLDSLMHLVGMKKVSVVNGRLIKQYPGISLDMNAIAQGYSVDVICRNFDGLGIRNYLVEIGGEVRAKGTRAGALWRIGIDRPVDDNMIPGRDLEAIIRISDKALATSGNYRKFYVENGVKYSHTIDPRTGYPARSRLLSATILADDCASADGIATACMVMGLDGSIEFLENHPEFSGYFIISDEKGNLTTWMSDNIKAAVTEQ